ncbi:MAG: branched-chain amino acid ABC transporter permease [Christensenellales bacterium]
MNKLLNKKTIMKSLAYVIAFALVVNLPFLMSSNYMLRVINMAMITYLCVLGVFVLLGMCGQNSFAQAGLWGVGAYILANMTVKLGIPSFIGMLISVLGTALLAFILGFAFFRLRQYYFTFSTIGLMVIMNGLFMNWTEVSGGGMGFSDIPSFSIGGFVLASEEANFFMILLFCIIATILIYIVSKSALGRSFMAIRDNEIAANCMGINSLITKNIAFAISGALCGLAGSLFAFLAGYLSYTTFTFSQSTMYLIMIMLGGTISPVGALIGSVSLTLLVELVRPLKDYMMLIFGVGIVVLMIVQPEGILGGAKELYERFSKRKQ